MPALFALGQHEALVAAKAQLLPDELLVALLDDIYIATKPDRARAAFDVVRQALKTHAGIDADLEKTRVWNKQGGSAPVGVAALGADVWRGDKAPEDNGLKVLGSPLGTAEYVSAMGRRRVLDEQAFADLLPKLPDLQAAWLLLVMCACPRANHLLRTVPPSLVQSYAAAHDKLFLDTLAALVRRDGFRGSSHQSTRHGQQSVQQTQPTGQPGLMHCRCSVAAARSAQA